MFEIRKIHLRSLLSNYSIASYLLVLFCVMIVPIEGGPISPVKVATMAICPLVFLLKGPIMTKALFWGLIYWLVCYFCSLLKGDVRFSTLGFLGLHLFMYITYYTLLQKGAFTFPTFSKLIRYFIIAHGVVAVLQQVLLLIGITHFPLLNMQHSFASITKLPLLALEPSHSARVLAVLWLAYLRCEEMQLGRKPFITELFKGKHKWVSIAFFWTMMTMGSGTAFVALGLLSVYFLTPKTIFYTVPLMLVLFLVASSLQLKEMNRATAVAEATLSGNNRTVIKADHSASHRVLPLLNSLKADFTSRDTWFGRKSMAKLGANFELKDDATLFAQYGLIAFICGMFFFYSCVIYRALSVETLLLVFLFGISLGNVYYVWGAILAMTGVSYFRQLNAKGLLMIENCGIK